MIRRLRSWWRSALVAVACTALGTGCAVFVMSIANGVLLKGPPFADADRLVRIWTTPEGTTDRRDLSYLDVRDIEARATSFDAVELTMRTRLALSLDNVTERLRGESVSPGYFDLVRTRPAIGRAFVPDEYAESATPVIIISHALWQRRFGGADDVVGRTVLARSSFGRDQDRTMTIVGVMPPGFIGSVDPDICDFWLPVQQHLPATGLDRRSSRGTWVLAHLRPGVSLTQASAEVERIGIELAGLFPEDYARLSLTTDSVGESFRDRYRDGIMLLTGVAAFLLLIACTNVMHLLLARLAQREQEFRVRTALGASRGSLIREVHRESLTISCLGGGLGVLLATVALRAVSVSDAFTLPPYVSIGPDLRVALAAVGLTVLTVLLSGGLPAWFGSRQRATERLRDEGRGATPGRHHRRSVSAIVAAEVAFSFVLLVGSALMVRSYGNLMRTDVGFRTDRLLRLALSLDASMYPDTADIVRFADALRAELGTHASVEGASVMGGTLPPWVDDETTLGVEGRPVSGLGAVAVHAVDPAFLDVMEIRLLAGRGIEPSDVSRAPLVAVVSARVARVLTGGDGRNAVGMTIATDIGPQGVPGGTPRTIVGVAEDILYGGPIGERTPDADLYLPLAQAPRQVLSIAVAMRAGGVRAQEDVVRLVSGRAPTSPMHWVSTMEEEFEVQFRDARLYAMLTGLFGVGAIGLVLLGIYGVIANAVVRRLAELSVRLAVGATPGQVTGLVVRQVAVPTLTGVALGGVVAMAVVRLVSTLVYGVDASDPVTFLVVAGMLMLASLAAAFVPAHKAGRLDPVTVLGLR